MPTSTRNGKPPIECKHDALVDVSKLIAHPRNPNSHPPAQIELLAKIIDFQGWRRPIVVSKRSGFIIRGHGALLAAQKAGWSEVPVDYQEYESEAQEWADLIADNRIAELAERNRPELKDLLEELDLGVLDMELTGFTDDALKELMSEFHIDPDEFDGLSVPDGDKPEFQEMTFTLHDMQAEEVKRALSLAKGAGLFVDSPNENSNGNALARICEEYVTRHGTG